MSATPSGLTVGHFCRIHRSSSPRLPVACPYGKHTTHVHENEVKAARRGTLLIPSCIVCKKHYHLVIHGKLKAIRAVPSDNGSPATQLTLDAKAH